MWWSWALTISTLLATTMAILPTEFTTDDRVLSLIADDMATKFENEYMLYLRTGVESPTLRQLSRQLTHSHSKRDIFTRNANELGAADQFVKCVLCKSTVNVFVRMVRGEDGELNGPNAEENIKTAMLGICARFEIQTAEVCEGLFNEHWAMGDFLLRNSQIDSQSFCSLFLGINMCSVTNREYNWTLPIDNGGSAVTGPKSDLPSKSADDLRILHLTDIHYDPLYKPDSTAKCDEPLCCQRLPTSSNVEENELAGYWGDYECDVPMHMIENALEHIKSTHPNIEYIYQTGDIVDHMVWATSVEKNKKVLEDVNNKITEVFPDVPVYPCIGNHEPHPLNSFSPMDAPAEINTKWLYEHLYDIWSKWLPASTKDTILEGGYYTVSPKPGFRIIALNNNECYMFNFWMYYNGEKPRVQLQWLHDSLLQAEEDGEYVHILGHIPSGSADCWTVWAREYNRIIERFRNTISAMFTGHTHKDEMMVHYSNNWHAVGISWNGGSLTSFTNKNPNYRIYEIEPTSWQVVDHETWIFNLTEAKLYGKGQLPRWFKEYVFSTEFTTDLSPAGIDKLLDRMASEPELLRQFWKYRMTSADPELSKGCSRNCLMSNICNLAKGVNDQRKRCEELQAKLALALDEEGSTTTPTTTTESITSTLPTTTTEDSPSTPGGDDGGAAALTALSMSTICAAILALKFFA